MSTTPTVWLSVVGVVNVCHSHIIGAKVDIQSNQGCKNNVPPRSRNTSKPSPPTLAVPTEIEYFFRIRIGERSALLVGSVDSQVNVRNWDNGLWNSRFGEPRRSLLMGCRGAAVLVTGSGE
jgi:hypothetical protein